MAAYLAGLKPADALNQPFADGEFDFVWSMESGEHMPGECVKALKNGSCVLAQTCEQSRVLRRQAPACGSGTHLASVGRA